MNLQEANAAGARAFADIAEHSPWVAERAFEFAHHELSLTQNIFPLPLVGRAGVGVVQDSNDGSERSSLTVERPPPLIPPHEGEGNHPSVSVKNNSALLLFSSREMMIERFSHAVMSATRDAQLSLLRAHPDLATRARLTADSTNEQKGAGLDTLSAAEFARFTELNDAYKAKNHFPFIFAVKGATKHQILAGFESRIDNDTDVEFQTALQQVCKIIRFRLEDRVSA